MLVKHVKRDTFWKTISIPWSHSKILTLESFSFEYSTLQTTYMHSNYKCCLQVSLYLLITDASLIHILHNALYVYYFFFYNFYNGK